MRKLTFALAVLASLGGAALVQPAAAAPIVPMGVSTPDGITLARMTPMERRMMRRKMERRMMRRDMERRMMRRRMMRRM